jgi:hypothetical protein
MKVVAASTVVVVILARSLDRFYFQGKSIVRVLESLE